MTILTIESDSETKTQQVLELVEKLGLSVKTDEHRILTAKDMVTGIGRKATDAELMEYLLKGENSEQIDFEEAFAKFLDK